MIWLILGILAIILVVVVFIIRQKSDKDESAELMEDVADLSVVQASVGDSISATGAGDDFDDLNFNADRRDRYESGGEQWSELSGVYNGRRVFLEVYDGDEVKVVANLGGANLQIADIGLSEDDLARMDESQDRSESFQHDGSQWYFQESGEVHYFKGDSSQAEGFYSWEFLEEDKRRILSVQKWEGEPFEVSRGQVINPDDVHVFRS